MKKFNLPKGIFVVSASSILLMIIFYTIHDPVNKLTNTKVELKSGEERGANGMAQYMFDLRKNPITGMLDYQSMIETQALAIKRQNAAAYKTSVIGSNWLELGPDNVGGRTRAILIDKNNPNTIFSGGVTGGIWKSENAGTSWRKCTGSDQLENIVVSCITQAANGDIYFGTGEYFMNAEYGLPGSSFIGGGIWKSTDGESFTRLAATVPTSINSSSVSWVFVNQLAADPSNSNRIYAATNKGLQMTDDGGTTWTNPISGFTSTLQDIKIGSDGSIIAVSPTRLYVSSGDGIFTNIPFSGAGLPTGVGRIAIAIAPSDPNYIYASIINTTGGGGLKGIYRSTDKGNNWSVIGPGGSNTFEPFAAGAAVNPQGYYDNAIAVFPNDKNHILVGGVVMWEWVDPSNSGGQWYQIEGYSTELHPDIHTVIFHPTNPNLFYVGTDGGNYKATYNAQSQFYPYSFYPISKNYNVTQCYSVAFEANGAGGTGVMGGTQDNGTNYISGTGNTLQSSFQTGGGDGGDCEISFINQQAFFTTVYYGSLRRSAKKGESGSSSGFYSDRLKAEVTGIGEDPNTASFVTPIALYESFSATNSPDSVTFIADVQYEAGSVIEVKSNTGDYIFQYTTPTLIAADSSVKIQDIIQSKLVVGFTGSRGVWMTKECLDFSKTPEWIKIISSVNGEVEEMKWSADGDILYVGTSSGYLYRLSGIVAIRDSATGEETSSQKVTVREQIAFFNKRIVSLAVDPNNADRLLVTLAGYGGTNNVYYCGNATTALSATDIATNFVSKQGTTTSTRLPAMPVYSALFVKNDTNPNLVLVGTDYGVYATTDITAADPVWTSESSSMANVAVFALRQQTLPAWNCNNSGNIYAGTFGRGIWKNTEYYIPTGIAESNKINKANTSAVSVSPNPLYRGGTVAFSLTKMTDVLVSIYDLQGKVIKTMNFSNLQARDHKISFDSSEIPSGTYLLSVKGEKIYAATRFIVAN